MVLEDAILTIIPNPATAISGKERSMWRENEKPINPTPKQAAASGILFPNPTTELRAAK
jgi:hypothetical protein